MFIMMYIWFGFHVQIISLNIEIFRVSLPHLHLYSSSKHFIITINNNIIYNNLEKSH